MSRRLVRIAVVAAVCALLVASCGADDAQDRVVIAAGRTLVDSGFLELVVNAYAEDTGADRPSVLGRSSREAMALAASGDADITITHEPVSLGAFLDDHPAASVTEPFASRFIVVAPAGTILDTTSVGAAFISVPGAGMEFVSRADGSGTHARELDVWSSAGIDPTGQTWYVRAGAGMGATLLIASERRAATLAELGAFLASEPELDLVAIPLDDAAGLDTPYQLTVVDPMNAGAAQFANWLVSPRGRAAVDASNAERFGVEVYRVP